jgi:ATP-dependent RNA helicase RhlE
LSFDAFDLHASITANIKALGYEAPTPIQREAIPHVASGRDVMGLAQTGTGKTAAFLLPIIDRFLKNPKPLRGSCRALVIAPTRELAEQIHESAREYTKGLRFRTVTVYGGVGMGPQTNNLRRGADIVVACPGRLLDHVNQGNANLSFVEALVLDEADHMFDMGFLPDIKRILERLPNERQTLLFSATMPDSIKGLANETLKDPALVRIGRSGPVQTIEQCLYPVPQHLKTKLLLNILGDANEGSVLVFTRTKHRAKRLAEQLGRSGHQSACLQGNLSQAQRQKAMEGFRSGRYRVMVATDIAARGIDVSRVAHVVNYDLPDTPETYTHRVGRTGRAEREGQAHSLVTSEDVSMVRAIERLLGKSIERRKIEGFDYACAAPERDSEFHRPPLSQNRYGQPRNGRNSSEPQPRSGRYASDSQERGSSYGDQPQARNSRQGVYGNAGRYGAEGSGNAPRQYAYSAEPGRARRDQDGNRAATDNRDGDHSRNRQPRAAKSSGGFYGRAPESANGSRSGGQERTSGNYGQSRPRSRQGGDRQGNGSDQAA